MEIRKKTIIFEYRHFDVGETVKGFLEPPSRINSQERFVVQKFTPPEESSECGTIVVEGISEDFPDWRFEPLIQTEKA